MESNREHEPAPDLDEVHRRQRVGHAAFLLVSLAVIAAAWLLEPTPARDGLTAAGVRLPSSCASMRLGLPCPGCGLTRSFVLGVRLDPEAFRLHRVGPLLLLLVAAQVPYRAWRLLRPEGRLSPEAQRRRDRLVQRGVWAVIAALLVNWAVTLVERFGPA